MLLMQGARVQSLVRKLRSCMPHGVAKYVCVCVCVYKIHINKQGNKPPPSHSTEWPKFQRSQLSWALLYFIWLQSNYFLNYSEEMINASFSKMSNYLCLSHHCLSSSSTVSDPRIYPEQVWCGLCPHQS